MSQLIQGKWYVSNLNHSADGVQGVGIRVGQTARSAKNIVSPPFDTAQEAEQWLDDHPEHDGTHIVVWKNLE